MKNTLVFRLAAGGLFILFTLLALGAQQTTLTADEPTYVASGYGLLARGREVFPILTQRGYPPLLIVLEAWPLYWTNPHIPVEQLAGWPDDYAAFKQAFEPYLLALPQMKVLVRLPIIWLTVLLGAVVFRWGKDLWGPKAGLLALGVLLFDPLLLGHGGLANSDAGTVALGTAALYATWRWRQKPAWRWSLAAGGLLGLTMLAKASGLLWVAAAGLMVVVTLVEQRQNRQRFGLLRQAAVGGAFILLTFWAGYGFEWGPIRALPWSLPAPTYWESLLYLTRYKDHYYALGLPETAGWWYFPLAFIIKNPLPLLIGLGLGLFGIRRRIAFWPGFLTLGFFPLLYTCTAMIQGENIGYRFMLPIHPFIYLIIGGGVEAWMRNRPLALARRWGVGLLAAWYVVMTLAIFPYEISFFNELVGGPDGGYRYLADSNVDWGQAQDVRQAYVQAHPETQVKPPAARYHPAPGRYLVSASFLQGVGIFDQEAYEWFRQRQPQAILAHSLLIYDVPPVELSWVAQCQKPVAPLNGPAITQGTGRDNLRQVSFDCTQNWLYPGGGVTNGLYALHSALFDKVRLCFPSFLACPPAPVDAFITRHLAGSRFSYKQTFNGQLPAFMLYERSAVPALPVPSAPIYAANEGTLPNALGAEPVPSPIRLDGPLALLGTAAYFDKESVEVETWWQVIGSPGGRPFSIMGQLIAADGTSLGSSDGLGVPADALAVGDIFVQRHRFARPPDQAGVSFMTGPYWLDTLKRWKLAEAPSADILLINMETAR